MIKTYLPFLLLLVYGLIPVSAQVNQSVIKKIEVQNIAEVDTLIINAQWAKGAIEGVKLEYMAGTNNTFFAGNRKCSDQSRKRGGKCKTDEPKRLCVRNRT